MTYIIIDYYGCAAAVDGAGFLLSNEMDDFAFKPIGTVGFFLRATRNNCDPIVWITPGNPWKV